MDSNRKWAGVLLIVLAVLIGAAGIAGHHHARMVGPWSAGGWHSGWGPGSATAGSCAANGAMMGFGTMGQGLMMNPGVTGGPDALAWMAAGGMLDLNDDQRRQIEKIGDEIRGRQWDLMAKLRSERLKLLELDRMERPDPAAVGAQYAKAAQLQRQLIELSLDARNRSDAVLDQAQLDRLRSWRRSWTLAHEPS